MPHLFITITLNPKDKRLLAFIKRYSQLPDPTAYNEPILTSVWYKHMMEKVLDAITGRK
jgi:hypothetical protein